MLIDGFVAIALFGQSAQKVVRCVEFFNQKVLFTNNPFNGPGISLVELHQLIVAPAPLIDKISQQLLSPVINILAAKLRQWDANFGVKTAANEIQSSAVALRQ